MPPGPLAPGTIVVGTDGSDTAGKAVSAALDLMRRRRATE